MPYLPQEFQVSSRIRTPTDSRGGTKKPLVQFNSKNTSWVPCPGNAETEDHPPYPAQLTVSNSQYPWAVKGQDNNGLGFTGLEAMFSLSQQLFPTKG